MCDPLVLRVEAVSDPGLATAKLCLMLHCLCPFCVARKQQQGWKASAVTAACRMKANTFLVSKSMPVCEATDPSPWGKQQHLQQQMQSF